MGLIESGLHDIVVVLARTCFWIMGSHGSRKGPWVRLLLAQAKGGDVAAHGWHWERVGLRRRVLKLSPDRVRTQFLSLC